MEWQDRIDNYCAKTRFPRSLFLGEDGRVVGTWIMGNDYRVKSGYYGGYPGGGYCDACNEQCSPTRSVFFISFRVGSICQRCLAIPWMSATGTETRCTSMMRKPWSWSRLETMI